MRITQSKHMTQTVVEHTTVGISVTRDYAASKHPEDIGIGLAPIAAVGSLLSLCCSEMRVRYLEDTFSVVPPLTDLQKLQTFKKS